MKTEAQARFAAMAILKGDDLRKLEESNLVVVGRQYLEHLKADLAAARQIADLLLDQERVDKELAQYFTNEQLQESEQATKELVHACNQRQEVQE